MNRLIDEVKREVLLALSHSEAEDGLFYGNFHYLHEEDERPSVHSSTKHLSEALTELVREGTVFLTEESGKVVFKLSEHPDVAFLRAS